MPNQREDIERQSEEVQDILTKIPHWIIRSGITLVSMVIAIFFIIAAFIHYPNTIEGRTIVSTENPTIELVCKQNSNITQIYFSEGSFVNKGDRIAVLDNTLSMEGKIYLEGVLDSVEMYLQKRDGHLELSEPEFTFGSIEQDYLSLLKSVHALMQFDNEDRTQSKLLVLRSKLNNQRGIRKANDNLLNIAEGTLRSKKERLEISKSLFSKEAISKDKLDQDKLGYSSAEEAYHQIKIARLNAMNAASSLESEIIQLEEDYSQAENIILDELNGFRSSIRNEISGWTNEYVITAPISGTLAYLDDVHKNLFVQNGQRLFAVIPTESNFKATVLVSTSGASSIKEGQIVRISLDKFPSKEFGKIEGKVTSVSLVPVDNKYRVSVTLINGLNTTNGKRLPNGTNWSGSAEIITKNKSLLGRIFNNLQI